MLRICRQDRVRGEIKVERSSSFRQCCIVACRFAQGLAHCGIPSPVKVDERSVLVEKDRLGQAHHLNVVPQPG